MTNEILWKFGPQKFAAKKRVGFCAWADAMWVWYNSLPNEDAEIVSTYEYDYTAKYCKKIDKFS